MKNENIYTASLCSVYDVLNDDVDTCGIADFLEKAIERFSDIKVESIAELACGTGSMAIELARRGYHITAGDISESMLCVADEKAQKNGQNIRFVLQDMRNMRLYKRADCAVCFLDSINYLSSTSELESTFSSVYESIKDGALFVFDINTKYKFENIYADNAYVIENEGVLCAWQNFYNPKSRMCDFYLSVFVEDEDGRYIRNDEHQRERCFALKTIVKLLEKCGFCFCGAFCDFDFHFGCEQKDERLYIIAKKEGKNE